MRAGSTSSCKTRNVALFSHDQTKITCVDPSRTTLLQTVQKNEILNHRIHPSSFRQTSSHWVTFYFGFQARVDGFSDMSFHRILFSTHVTCEQGTVQCPLKMDSTGFHSRHQSRLSCPRTWAAVQSTPWKQLPDLCKLHFPPRNGQKSCRFPIVAMVIQTTQCTAVNFYQTF